MINFFLAFSFKHIQTNHNNNNKKQIKTTVSEVRNELKHYYQFPL